MDENKLQNLEKMLSTLYAGTMNQKDFTELFEVIVEFVKKTKDLTGKELENIRQLYSDIKSSNEENLAEIKERIADYCRAEFSQLSNQLVKKHNSQMSEIEIKVQEIEDSKDANDQRVIKTAVEATLARIPPVKELEVETPETIKDKLESLKEEARLDKSAIKGLEDMINRLENRISSIPRGGSARASHSTKFYKLTPDGSTKIFSVPKSVTSIVLMSDFPHVLFEGSANGFTINGARSQITLTSTSSQLLYQYSTFFNE